MGTKIDCATCPLTEIFNKLIQARKDLEKEQKLKSEPLKVKDFIFNIQLN